MSSHEAPNKSNADPERVADLGNSVAILKTFRAYPMITMLRRLQSPAGLVATGGYRGHFQGFSPFLATLVTAVTVDAAFENYVKPHYPKGMKDNVMFNDNFDAGELTTSHVCMMPKASQPTPIRFVLLMLSLAV